MSEGEHERWRDNGTFGPASDRWLLLHGKRCVCEQLLDLEVLRRAQRLASESDMSLMLDHYFKSRTPAQLRERLEVLLRDPSAAAGVLQESPGIQKRRKRSVQGSNTLAADGAMPSNASVTCGESAEEHNVQPRPADVGSRAIAEGTSSYSFEGENLEKSLRLRAVLWSELQDVRYAQEAATKMVNATRRGTTGEEDSRRVD
jgi:hypothetical protein